MNNPNFYVKFILNNNIYNKIVDKLLTYLRTISKLFNIAVIVFFVLSKSTNKLINAHLLNLRLPCISKRNEFQLKSTARLNIYELF